MDRINTKARTTTGDGFLSFLILLVFAIGCTHSNSIYNKIFELPVSGWSSTATMEDSWMSTEPVSNAPVILEIVFSPEFGYQNLYLTGNFQQNGQILWADTFSVQLGHSKGGGWQGKKKGDFIIVNDTLPATLTLENGQEFSYQISQYSREDSLVGIKSIAIKVGG